jgi:hypothetical protein
MQHLHEKKVDSISFRAPFQQIGDYSRINAWKSLCQSLKRIAAPRHPAALREA